ncbi:TIGR02646 family protein [Pseudomonas asturiensis]|uniref:TIGR02646 family protein n=1 Tax=Pseudomonas asturiensis TaxID=1190415 RepID=A0A1M7QHH6_9PSED|nr:HNH endonuclease [Pseudomonas asturiensis]SHN30479.1 TIGR02646 family protein [Pseudomonas asturiensis]
MTFFPEIVRCEKYDVKKCGGYHGYSYYKDQIHEDCQYRCVYCDVKLDECGHEGFALDHFRPQEKFPHLTNDPTNLVAACAKCNRSKSSHWPVDILSGVSFQGAFGFIDPFQHKRLDFFFVEVDGKLTAKQDPSNYLIKLLGLNRPSRVVVRKNRLLQRRVDELIILAESIIEEIIEVGEMTEVSWDKLKSAKAMISSVRQLRLDIAVM